MKKLLSLLLASASIGLVNAQTINGSDVNPVVGDNFIYHNTDYISPGNSGIGQTWDYSSMVSTGQETVNYTASAFANANITQTYGSGVIVHWNYSASGQDIIAQIAQGVTIEYTNPWTFFGLPLSMGTSGSDTFFSTFNSGGTTFTRSGTTTWEVDGTGTLITPTGTYTDVIRVKTNDDYSDESIFMDIEYLGETYFFLKAGVHHPLASVTTLQSNISGTIEYGTYLDVPSASLENNELIFTIYPNPTSDFLNISTLGNTKFDKIEIVDMNGKVVIESISNQIDVHHLNVGMYMILLIGKDQGVLSRQKFLKK